MRHFLLIFCLLCHAYGVIAQQDTVLEKGAASYVSSQHVYVKFSSTEHIRQGDTLYLKTGDKLQPALLVKDKSSTSCVCTSLLTEKVKVGTEFHARTIVARKKESSAPQKDPDISNSGRDSTFRPPPLVVAPASDEKDEHVYKQKIKGRISAASYSSLYDGEEQHRMRYTLTFQGNHLKNSRFSTDNYISFRHTLGEWGLVKQNLNDALKIYSLSVKYDLDKASYVCLGRKINQRISSMGAIDGLQLEKGIGKWILGAIAGSRPDYRDYSINLDLFQAGAYVGLSSRKNNKSQESTLAFVEQHNHSKVDRRFVYFQHSNTLAKDLSLFGSMEMDLYQLVDSVVHTSPSLTNLLLSLQYRLSKKFSLSVAYDNRKNIIYYESYKNFIDQLIDNETRQGMRLGVNARMTKKITGGANYSWRYQKSGANFSENLNAYLNFSNLPWIKANGSLTANILKTGYLNSHMYGVSLTREIIREKLNAELHYRWVEYQYANYENTVRQHIPGVDLSWNITRKLALYLYYEGTFDKQNPTFTRVNTRLIQRF